MAATSTAAPELDLERMRRVLPPPAHVLYAPPHVFPMSVPDFEATPEAVRPALSGTDPLALYVHIPYCRYACSFCFYVKTVGADRAAMERYVGALHSELRALPEGTPLNQLFLGGGTPTALPPDLLDSVLEAALRPMDRSAESTHTVECSPETITPEHIEVLVKHGVKRISMGIQSTSDEVLGTVHRHHTGREALAACRRIAASGTMLNVDLIYGLPGQTEQSFRDDLAAVVDAGAQSLNLYNLRVNEATPVMRSLREDERLELANLLRWRALVMQVTQELGFRQTHWQRFLKAGVEFDLNLTSANLFGAGASARSFLGGTVYRNHPGLPDYVSRVEAGRSPVEEVFRLDAETRKTYHVTRTLGAGKSLDPRAYEREFGCSFDADYGPTLKDLGGAGLLAEGDGLISMTAAGRLAWDLVTLAFYPPQLRAWLESRHSLAEARRRPAHRSA